MSYFGHTVLPRSDFSVRQTSLRSVETQRKEAHEQYSMLNFDFLCHAKSPYAECHCVKCHGAECYCVKSHCVKSHCVKSHSVKSHSVKRHCVKRHCVKRHCVKRHCVKYHWQVSEVPSAVLSVNVPSVTLPSVNVPSVTLPSVTVKRVTVPSALPSVNVPSMVLSISCVVDCHYAKCHCDDCCGAFKQMKPLLTRQTNVSNFLLCPPPYLGSRATPASPCVRFNRKRYHFRRILFQTCFYFVSTYNEFVLDLILKMVVPSP
jgi:hypothetical protein